VRVLLAATSGLSAAVFLCAAGSAQAQLVAVDDSYGVPYGEPLVVEAPGVLSNDTYNGDPAEDAGATAELLTYPVYGTLSCDSDPAFELCPDGSFIYTPDSFYAGADSFVYQAGVGVETAQATVTLTACTGGPSVFTCWQESPYLAKLAELGYGNFQEGFEDDLAWGGVRSPDTAPSVVSQGIAWETNHRDPPASNEITTGAGPTRTGEWGVYDPDHGYATGTPAECDVDVPPPHCLYQDGLTGIREVGETTLYGVGGYFTGSGQPNLALLLDGGMPIVLGRSIVGGHQFFGVIDTAGFATFRFEETDGKVGQQRLVFADDFVFGTTPADTTPPQVAWVGSYADTGDGVLGEGEVTGVAITELHVSFSELVSDLGGEMSLDSVSNPANYLLFSDGGDGFDTVDCATGVDAGDVSVSVDWVTYTSGSERLAALEINGGLALSSADYRLLVCGTTSIRDWAGNALDGDGNGFGGDDFERNFTVAVNRPPVAVNDGYTEDEDVVLKVAAPGVLGNDSDPDGNPITASRFSDPTDGLLTLLPDGSFTYTPDPGFFGTDSFTYRAFDGSAFSNIATVTITVNPIDDFYSLQVSVFGAGSGVVTSNPLGIDCGVDCSEIYLDGTVVTLTPTADPDSKFVAWSGDPDCTDGQVTMTAAVICDAQFEIRVALYCFDFVNLCDGIEVTAVLPDKTVVGTWRNWDCAGGTAPLLGGYSGKSVFPRMAWLGADPDLDLSVWSFNMNVDGNTFDLFQYDTAFNMLQTHNDQPFTVTPGACLFSPDKAGLPSSIGVSW